MASVENIKLLMLRPTEPHFMPKGPNDVVFDSPKKYKPEKYQAYEEQLTNRFGNEAGMRVPVKNISIPNMDEAMELGRREQFTLWLPRHRKMAKRLIDIFMAARNLEDLQALAVYARERVNPYLFNYSLSVALLHRQDSNGTGLPNIVESFPDKFVDSGIFSKAREQAKVVPEGSRTPIIIPKDYTASDLDPEHRVAYFREDPAVNSHHWHWHLVYPFDAADLSIVNKDRRGELFYYMHKQLVARYDFERLSNGLPRVKRYKDFNATIDEGYFPKLDSLVASRAWPPRFANSKISDLNRPADRLKQDVSDMEQWRIRLRSAIAEGFVVDTRNREIPLTEDKGIDILGNILESSVLSVNRSIYGDFHNLGHIFLSFTHDPDHRNLENFAVIGDTATTMRDPIFFRWHSYIDDLFQLHKGTLPRYSVARLDYPGVQITNLSVAVSGGQPNELETFWQRSAVDMSRGLDFSPRGSVFIEFSHLQHKPFTYNIAYTNQGQQRLGTVRIFLAPKLDERGVPILFRDQRHLFIEMDKFTVTLRSGNGTITRRSDQSSVTIPFERSFRNLDANRPAAGTAEALAFDFCGCGWPQHMLVPKGKADRMACQLFAMISNYEDDKIDQANPEGACNDAASFCGLRDRKYPDKRSMGYPFDREGREGVDTLQAFLTKNMGVREVFIRFSDVTIPRNQVQA